MVAINTSRTIGEIVAEHPEFSRVFERFGIDYCCGGSLSLQDACMKKGVDTATILSELERQPADPALKDWSNAPAGDVIAHILETHHEYLHAELPRLEHLIEKVARVHGDTDANLKRLRTVFLALQAELEEHLTKEENILFPMIQQLGNAVARPSFHCGTVENPIRVMTHEHDNAGQALEEIRTLTHQFVPPEGACNTWRVMLDAFKRFEADMHQHVHLENNILFPLAKKLEASL